MTKRVHGQIFQFSCSWPSIHLSVSLLYVVYGIITYKRILYFRCWYSWPTSRNQCWAQVKL